MERRITRRAAIFGFGSALLLGSSQMKEITKELAEKLEDREAKTIAHNAALTPVKFERALECNVQFVEVDITEVNKQLVVVHAPEDYLHLPSALQVQQDPIEIINRIILAGKLPFLDIKDEVLDMEKVAEITRSIPENPNTMVSSNNHALLMNLRTGGFSGPLLFSIGSMGALRAFFEAQNAVDFSDGNYGVSIRHSLLWEMGIPERLKEKNLKITAWNPNTPNEILSSLRNGADFVTSDNFSALSRIGQNSKLPI